MCAIAPFQIAGPRNNSDLSAGPFLQMSKKNRTEQKGGNRKGNNRCGATQGSAEKNCTVSCDLDTRDSRGLLKESQSYPPLTYHTCSGYVIGFFAQISSESLVPFPVQNNCFG